MSTIAATGAAGPRAMHPAATALRAAALAVVVVVATLVLPARPASAEVTFNQRVLELVNRERSARGLSTLVIDPVLAGTAEDAPYTGCGFTVYGRAKDMGLRNYFAHDILGCPAQSVFDILKSTGLVYSGAGENLAWMNGTTDPLVAAENLFSQWMQSTGHRDNILSANWTRIGIGSWRSAPGTTWSGGGYALPNVYIGVQIFAGGAMPAPTTAPAGRYHPLSPARILDTRDGTGIAGAVAPGATTDLQITGRAGIPATDVAAVAMTVTVTQPSAPGYLTLFPSGISRPLAANLNFGYGETVSNLVVVKVGAGGRVSIYNPAGSSHVIADVAGWYSTNETGNAGRFESVSPARILDTRTGLGGGVRVGPGASIDLQVTGQGGIPASGVQAAAMNVAVTGATAPSYLTLYPTGEARPLAATFTFPVNTTASIRTMVKLGAGGKVTIYNAAGSTEVIIDINGWYTDGSAAGTLGALTPVTPSRVLDTRDGTGGISGAIPADGSVDVQITGRGGVPSTGVRAVILNATVTGTAAPGYLTIHPAGTARPLVSDLNFNTGETRPNLVVVQVGAGGKVSLFSAAGTHVIFDVAGWVS